MQQTDSAKTCGGCGCEVPIPPLEPGQSLLCNLCDQVVRERAKPATFEWACALSLTGCLLVLLANVYPILQFSVAGNSQENLIITGVKVLFSQGFWPIAGLVMFCAMLAPTAYFVFVAYGTASCCLGRRLPGAARMLQMAGRLEPWSLIPVFAAACVVAVVKLDMIGTVTWQAGMLWVTLLAGCSVALGQIFRWEAAVEYLEELP